ncbi:valine--tRNA ligase [Selenomonadales bacterium OttesenSCG-928-I06]|nr:valine--tRNA ligase [Selenomonadales bacterium OttesenSCG-928-I06]
MSKEQKEIASVYNPEEIEKKYYKYWEEQGLFHADENDTVSEKFSIVIPPPNVTGQLHMGHALDETVQDILIRYKKLRGYNALWVPGTDHAGIATQIKVEEALAEKNISRHDIGREAFITEVWKWKEQYGSRITNQLRSLGSACDWDRERFTMDEGCSKAVRETFVSLYEEGLIYKGTRIINWCPRCNTALSDIEVEHEDTQGHLYHIRYFLEGSSDPEDSIVVATTRPETMLGDTAVAVHPEDKRYERFAGKNLILPISERKIPVILDEYVEKEFGTGAVKITPAHDPNDFEVGLRHQLPHVVAMDSTGIMTSEAGKYEGMERYECRKQLLKDLDEQGYLVKVEDHDHAIGHCQRCSTIVEPMASAQWFVKMDPLAKPAIEAINNGTVKVVPERFTKIFINWLEGIRDWCISRQIWWGHRIPAWYCSCGEVIVSREDPAECPKCGGKLEQDPDVLDTWFSSALWPFSTLGWPEETQDLKTFYPTSVLVTAYDIIFFWVTRMIMMGLKFTGQAPFSHVFLHGLVRDSEGKKMSKSLGNGIDPLDVIDKYSADALRFMLITGNTPGNDTRFYWERVEASRNFSNKLWNASRFTLLNTDDFDPDFVPTSEDYTLADKFILTRYAKAVEGVTRNIDKYELGEAARMLYEFIWDDFCDWYLELVKPRLYNKEDAISRKTAQYTLIYVLSNTLKLLHPFMPFITEAIWQMLPENKLSDYTHASIMKAKWPEEYQSLIDSDSESLMTTIMDIIKAIRNMRSEVNAPPGRKSEVIIEAASNLKNAIIENMEYISKLAAAEPITIKDLAKQDEKPENALTKVVAGVEIYLPLKGL